uniref:Uncharacterized protein n=1 Tax=Chromera velia CCMP2878 TaxID=1169474 RepID=A0A0G4F9E6_9ALVE|eukprot:Cvel_15856.t1-p1 / transcript=Cvel_15856.t1 / gene=Cvel_15856 / organism=Chromera_velia_CCMP2878 / gene_product=hypothetical protein / transcript_product=hypothetical protein / location=Cvel_scaffold1195:21737-23640(-) / protein_length=318 / sequence_SO=supercontig / SO=protein_coding / is_pseudo=false
MLVYVGVAPRSGRFGNICSGCLDVEELKFLADVQNEFRGGCLGCKLPSCVFSHQECLAGLRDTFPQFKTSVPTLKRFDVENMCSVVPQCDILGATRQNRRDCVKIGNWTCKQKPESEVCVMADNSKQWESEGSFKAFDRRFKDTCCTLAPLVHAIVWLLLVNTCVLLVAIIFDVGATFCCPEQFDPQWGKAKVHQYGHGGDAEGDHEAPTTNVHRVNPAGSHYPGHPPYPPPYPQTQSLPAPGKYAAGEGPFEGNSILYEGGTAAVTTGIPVERGTEGARAETQTQQQGVVALHSSGHEPAVLGRSREDLEEDAETQC